MTPSIRTFLLINLLLSVTLITSLAVIGNLFLAHKEIRGHLDARLLTSALTIQAFMQSHAGPNYLKSVQRRINRISEVVRGYYGKTSTKTLGINSPENIQFQVWDHDGTLLLYSYGVPKQPFTNTQGGFTDEWVDGQPWRVFTDRDVNTGLRVVVAEKYDFREELEGRITEDSIFIMLITYPFLGLLIWIIVGRGLDTLKEVASEVRHRAPTYLKPVDLESVPAEVQPLVDELNKLFARLGEAFEREKRFAADAAHELRTPLAALRAQTHVALNATTGKEQQEALRKLLASVDRSTHVVQQLLTLSRMMPGAALTELTSVDLSKVATEVIAELAPEAVRKDIEIELIPGKSAVVEGNAVALGILIRNLVDNAIRYTTPGGWVKVYTNSAEKSVSIRVVDNGPGIPAALRERVFERFFRMIGNESPGSGLGLGIVQQIAQLHKASVSLDTPESGQGLEVIVTFTKHQKSV